MAEQSPILPQPLGSSLYTEQDWYTWGRSQRQEQLAREAGSGAKAVGTGNSVSPRKMVKDSFHSRILGERVKPVLSPEVREKAQGQRESPASQGQRSKKLMERGRIHLGRRTKVQTVHIEKGCDQDESQGQLK